MEHPMLPDSAPIRSALSCTCPKCGVGALFKPGRLHTTVNETCPHCGFPLGNHDSADGPAVLLIFVLGALLVPLALLLEFKFSAPWWMHVIVLGGLMLGITLGSLRPLKAYVIALQVKHRPDDLQG